jgi:hypothetical protein
MDTRLPVESISDDQIVKIGKLVTAKLQKRKDDIPYSDIEIALEISDFADDIVGVIMKKITRRDDRMVRRIVDIMGGQSAEGALKSTRRSLSVDTTILDGVAVSEESEVEIAIFDIINNSGTLRSISYDDLDREYELRDLEPANLYALAAFNRSDPSFASIHENLTVWKDSNGRRCCALFGHNDDGPGGDPDSFVYVRFAESISLNSMFRFAGVRKKNK